MIAIVNISKHSKPTGFHKYELRINSEVITTFRHKREDGLAVCLEKAAKAVRKTHTEQLVTMISLFNGDGI